MTILIRTFVFMAFGWFMAAAALADPVLEYTFETTSITCNPSPRCDAPFLALERERLDTMYIGLSPSALSNGSATLRYTYVPGTPPVPVVNSGVESMGIYLYFTGLVTQVYPNGYLIGPEDLSSYLLTDMSLAVGQFLTGFLTVNDVQAGIIMSTPPGATQWQGRYTSDDLDQNIEFTGNWRFSNVVSEPGTVALFVVSLALMGMALRRRNARSPAGTAVMYLEAQGTSH